MQFNRQNTFEMVENRFRSIMFVTVIAVSGNRVLWLSDWKIYAKTEDVVKIIAILPYFVCEGHFFTNLAYIVGVILA